LITDELVQLICIADEVLPIVELHRALADDRCQSIGRIGERHELEGGSLLSFPHGGLYGYGFFLSGLLLG